MLAATGCQSQATAEAPTSVQQSQSAPALDTPRLASADNFRDLAGLDTAYAAGDGFLRTETVYRSNALDIEDADLETLTDLGISTVIDLRTPAEIEEHPDRVPEGAEYVNIDILGGGTTAANPNATFEITTPENSAKMLEEVNLGFVEDPGQRAQFAKVLTTIAKADGPVVYHCTAGKDRAGWTSAVLQLAAGVDREDVMENYLATNDYSADRIAATTEQIREEKGDEAADAYEVLLGVQADFLETGLDAMESEYGDIEGYLSEGLGLDDATIEQLRDKLVA